MQTVKSPTAYSSFFKARQEVLDSGLKFSHYEVIHTIRHRAIADETGTLSTGKTQEVIDQMWVPVYFNEREVYQPVSEEIENIQFGDVPGKGE